MGWIGAAFLLVGRYYIGKSKNGIGFLLSFVGDALWMLVGFQVGNFALIFTGGSVALLDLKRFFNRGGGNPYWNSLLLLEYRKKWWQVWK